MNRQTLVVGALALLAAAVLVPVALADRVYHSEHLDWIAAEGAPLRGGFVENVHPNGPNVFAHEIYALTGAAPNESYQVTLLIYPFAPDCTGVPAMVPTATLETNAAGNGRADAFLAPADIGPALRNNTHGVGWTLSRGASVVYRTACTSVTLD